jgi:hypothetical protein
MRRRTTFILGFVAGIAVWLSGEAPHVLAFLATPLEWLGEVLHPFPSESLLNLVIALPLGFLYWGCLGGLLGLLLRAACIVLLKPKRHDGA